MNKRTGRNERKLAEYAKRKGRAKAISDVNIDARRNYRREAYYQPENIREILESFKGGEGGTRVIGQDGTS